MISKYYLQSIKYSNNGILKRNFLSKSSSIAPIEFNRWSVFPAAVVTHLSIGGLYAWSYLNEPIARTVGVVVSANGDWGLSAIVPVFSTAVGFAGANAAFSGKWSEDAGPRKSVFAAGVCWGGGMMLAGLGVHLHQLSLVYLGYGVLGGTGIGFAYGPPVATLLRWFPDKKGLASGMVIMGFGAGAVVALPMMRYLIDKHFVSPNYLGASDSVKTFVMEGGRRFLVDNPTTEVVIATSSDIGKLGLKSHLLEPGVYELGTGNTGVAATLVTMGAFYAGVTTLASLGYKIPALNWIPPQQEKKSSTLKEFKQDPLIIPDNHYVSASDAMKSRQFAQVWTSLFLNATAGIAVLGVAKTLMSDVFGSSMPNIVDAQFCIGYVGLLSLSNGLGRLGWAAASDRFGRQKTFATFFVLGTPLYLSIPYTAHLAEASNVLPLSAFIVSSVGIISMYGGGWSVSPAYLADLFGNREVGNIYGKLLTAWSAAGLLGPTLLAYLRRQSEVTAIQELATKVDPDVFQKEFGSNIDQLQTLIQANSVTIDKLLPLATPGTIDPTPFLYDSTMKGLSILLVIGFINNQFMKPVDPKLWKKTL